MARRRVIVAALVAILAASFCICLCLGIYSVPLDQAIRIVANMVVPGGIDVTWTPKMQTAIASIRLPRLIAAGFVGAGLALSGATYQGIFKNPLVSPDILGVSSGACVGAAFALLAGFPSFGVQASALAMGLVGVLLAVSIPRLFRNRSTLMLVLSGVIVSGFMSSMLGLAKYLADPEEQLASIVFWTMGSFSTIGMSAVVVVLPAMIVSMIALVAMRWRINLLSMGDAEARSLGVNVARMRGLAILFSTILTACSVCLCGTIGWVGLIVPHMGRLIAGHDNRFVIPAAGLIGATFMIIVDTLARNLTGSEIPISILTGVIGAPLFVILLSKQRTRMD